MMPQKKVLFISFHFPPSSGAAVQRILKATEYLPEFGWDSIVLTAKSSAYDAIENTQTIPESVRDHVFRTLALDAHKHLAIKGKHLGILSILDRWTTWIPGAILRGHKIIKQYRPDVICSSSPIPSAHFIAYRLSKTHNIPWVADYQDPFGYHGFPTPPLKTKVQKYLDRLIIDHCSCAIFATNQAREIYIKAFKHVDSTKLNVIENGFDDENWIRLASYSPSSHSPMNQNKFSLFYSGVLYPNGRNPLPVFDALSKLKREGTVSSKNFELVFQGSGDGSNFSDDLAERGISDLVSFSKKVPFLDSLYHMTLADALLIIQDEVFNQQVPGKIYEYFRSGKPIIVVSPSSSATSQVAKSYGQSRIAEGKEEIADAIRSATQSKNDDKIFPDVEQYSRRTKSGEFARIFNRASGGFRDEIP